MAALQKNNTFLSYIILLLSFFILVLFTKDQIMNISVNIDIQDTAKAELESLREERQKIDVIKSQLQQAGGDIGKYKQGFSEDEIIDYMYSFVENYSNSDSQIVIRNMSFSEPKQNEFGFHQVDINMSLRVGGEGEMVAFLDFLVQTESKYQFFIDTFSYPNDNRGGGYTINVPVKMFYK